MAATVMDTRPELGSQEWWEMIHASSHASGPHIPGPRFLSGSPKEIAGHIEWILEQHPLGAKRGDIQFEYLGHGVEATGYEGHMLMVNWRVKGKFGVVGR